MAERAVDLWSGREFVVRLVAGHELGVSAPEPRFVIPLGPPVLWRSIAPARVHATLREAGVDAAYKEAEAWLDTRRQTAAIACARSVTAALAYISGRLQSADHYAAAVIAAEDGPGRSGQRFRAALASAHEVAALTTSSSEIRTAHAARIREAEGTIGENDMSTALANIATAAQMQGDLDGARRLHEAVVEARKRLLGPEHPNTLTSINNLANTLYAQGDLDGARRLRAQELSVLGEEL